MPLVIPAGYAQCSAIHQHNDTLQAAVCTFGVNTDDPLKLADVGDAWRDHMLAEMNNVFTYVRFNAAVTGGTIVSAAYSSAGAGGGSGTSPQVSYLFRKITAHPGRKGHGRMFYPGCDETSVDSSGRVSSGKQGGLNTMAGAFQSALHTIDASLKIYLLHNSSTGPYEVVALVAESIVATQRRRLKR